MERSIPLPGPETLRLRSAITCIRGSRSSLNSPQHNLSPDLVVAEAHLSLD